VRRFNLLHGEVDRSSEDYGHEPGFIWREAWVGDHLGSERIGGSLYELPPGQTTFPYHFHYGNEEWMVVVTGEPTLRSPDGEQRLRPGDVVCFPRGPEGAHQIRNDGDEPTRVLLLSTLRSPDVVRYPDSDKIRASTGTEDSANFVRSAAVDYWEGER
jgi:uncharacterized cupin superfamily protein